MPPIRSEILITEMKILLIGKGYIGYEFLRHLADSQFGHESFYASHDNYYNAIEGFKPDAVINAAAFIPQPSVSECDKRFEETAMGNLIFPMALAKKCNDAGIILAQLSTACLFNEDRKYTEADIPVRGLGDHCGAYVGSKLIMEGNISRICPDIYIFRIRLPFDRFHSERNYLSKLIRYPQVYDHLNSLSHRADCVKAMLDLVTMKADFGMYHCVNPGSIPAREVVRIMRKKGLIDREPEWVPGPCTGCTLSTDKLLAAGVKIRNVEDAVLDSIENWVK